jgi:hypothetical protein
MLLDFGQDVRNRMIATRQREKKLPGKKLPGKAPSPEVKLALLVNRECTTISLSEITGFIAAFNYSTLTCNHSTLNFAFRIFRHFLKGLAAFLPFYGFS